jgi:hypothetical protein
MRKKKRKVSLAFLHYARVLLSALRCVLFIQRRVVMFRSRTLNPCGC